MIADLARAGKTPTLCHLDRIWVRVRFFVSSAALQFSTICGELEKVSGMQSKRERIREYHFLGRLIRSVEFFIAYSKSISKTFNTSFLVSDQKVSQILNYIFFLNFSPFIDFLGFNIRHQSFLDKFKILSKVKYFFTRQI